MDEIVLPGEVISETTENLMPGLGVTVRDGKIIATVRGTINRVSQYISVTPKTSIYSPNTGDIVVGRISQVLKQRWKIQVGCSVLADLRLSSIYLPDDQFRRRTTTDERNMRQYFDVGDLLCAEVQQVTTDGVIFLHTRQQHPRKLDNGIVVEVPARLIKRVQMHMADLEIEEFTFKTIIGLNGSIWISPVDDSSVHLIPRIKNVIILLATYHQLIYLDSVKETYMKTAEIPVNKIVDPATAKFLNFI
ncbi:exonuclease [Tritrichomonas foetus]|uniref:Exonuclease n=1 Tax=Tritrichomonas foetus TaxID=1144522 RepID=A0A1J4KBJ7_9EUKA|nr:exonuclease [Tritrichomonas foetus]|eukprot:OHT06853.1 exonuclease [Tritrichomonas foetus]